MNDPEAPLSFSRWDLLAAGSLVALGLVWFLVQDRLPPRVPIHFDLAGNANRWAPRSAPPWLVFALPVVSWLLFWLMDLAMAGANEETATKMANARPMRGLTTLGLAGPGLALLLIPLYGLWILWVALGFLFLCLGAGIWATILASRRAGTWDGDEHYVWGIFYVNAQDERIWIPKRIGIGWTLNFGRPAGWLVMALLLAPLLLILLLARR